MRCTSCDFKVASFDDFEWDRSTDYLFLRNNAPDFERLKSKLNRKRGEDANLKKQTQIELIKH